MSRIDHGFVSHALGAPCALCDGSVPASSNGSGRRVFSPQIGVRFPVPVSRPLCPHCGQRGYHATDWDCLRSVGCSVAKRKDGGTVARMKARPDFDQVCVQGHPWTEATTARTKAGARVCRVCKRERQRGRGRRR